MRTGNMKLECLRGYCVLREHTLCYEKSNLISGLEYLTPVLPHIIHNIYIYIVCVCVCVAVRQ